MRPLASLSVDLDNEWSYLKTRGVSRWTEFPSFLDQAVPHILSLADELDLRLTFFVVGKDAELDVNRDALTLLGTSRHEIANHSFMHEPWLHRKTDAELKEEIVRTDEVVGAATGRTLIGFRAPGYSVSKGTIRTLVAAGYRYDASSLPTFIGPLARAFYARAPVVEDGTGEEMKQDLFGRWRDGLRSNRAHLWTSPGMRSLLEIPVTTMPVLRLPVHTTYLFQIARSSEALARSYLRMALNLCRLTGTQPSFLLHALDFLGGDDVDSLGFFPTMDMAGQDKRRLVSEYLSILRAHYRVVAVEDHVAEIDPSTLRVRDIASLM